MHEHELVKNPISKGDLLLVVTSATNLGQSETGAWLSEVAVPYCTLKRGGYDITIATPQGGQVPLDKASLKVMEQEGPAVQSLVDTFQADETVRQMMANSVPLDSVSNVTAYRGIFLAGGHGASVDFPSTPKLQQIVTEALDAGIVVAAVCHGVAVFASEELGKKVAGRRLTGFSDAEERAVGREGEVPFLLESRLRELGVNLEIGEPNTSKVVVDGNLFTGQNPQSAAALAQAVLEYLDSHRTQGPESHPGTMTAAEVPQALHVPPILPGQTDGVARIQAGGDMETDDVVEPSLKDNLGVNAEPNPGTYTGNDAPASA